MRDGSVIDLPVALRLLDDAIAWLVAHGRTGQWGSTPFSASVGRRDQVEHMLRVGRTRIGEVEGGDPVGISVLADSSPSYVPSSAVPELYIHLLVTDRTRTGTGIGRLLVEDATGLALACGARQLRVDCFAGSGGGLVDAYRRLGFAPSGSFQIDRADQSTWPGCILTKAVGRSRTGEECPDVQGG